MAGQMKEKIGPGKFKKWEIKKGEFGSRKQILNVQPICRLLIGKQRTTEIFEQVGRITKVEFYTLLLHIHRNKLDREFDRHFR